jgi:hypothetical protein
MGVHLLLLLMTGARVRATGRRPGSEIDLG